ncbi:MAG: GNAT family N-acetyltransferase [Tissierellia bacterium]|nr:GNAT family N-acetyltransferase [Tissierellia bacterium]
MKIAPIRDQDLKRLYTLLYPGERPDWKEWDGPYFDDYHFKTKEEFLEEDRKYYVSDAVQGIYDEEEIVGVVTRHFEDEKTRWMEVGIVIFETRQWNRGIGKEALRQWITDTFHQFPELMHLGLTTWSGNYRMMGAALSLGMKEEGRIRKVRYHKNTYYDSVKYGVLREEWEEPQKRKTIYDGIRFGATEEDIEVLWEKEDLMVERIVSSGQTTDWQDNVEDEYCILLQGEATIAYEDGRKLQLFAGDTQLIPAHTVHRVAKTSEYCLWICVKHKS